MTCRITRESLATRHSTPLGLSASNDAPFLKSYSYIWPTANGVKFKMTHRGYSNRTPPPALSEPDPVPLLVDHLSSLLATGPESRAM